jgi:hypothetical protein
MASIDRKRKKCRFIGIPYHVANSEQFARLKAPEVKLLVDLLMQFNGNNNGMLSPCYTLMKKRGWAKSSLYRAYSSLVHLGFIVVTRQGIKVRGNPTLIAVTWEGIDDPIKVKFDTEIKVSPVPLSFWRLDKSQWSITPNIKSHRKSVPYMSR